MTAQSKILAGYDAPDARIGHACHVLIRRKKKITMRAVAAELGVAHTTLSRDAERKAQIERCKGLQALVQSIEATQRGSVDSVSLAKARKRIQELEAENAMLIASHKAMIMAVGELGGMRAWRRFFDDFQEVVDRLEHLGALRETVVPLHPQKAPEGH